MCISCFYSSPLCVAFAFSSLFLSTLFPFDFSVLSFCCCNFTVLHCCPICLHFAFFFRFICFHSCSHVFLFFIFLLFVIHLLIPFNFISFCLHIKVFKFFFFILAYLCLVINIMFWFLILFSSLSWPHLCAGGA